MTSDYVIVSIKLCLGVGNDEYIILCKFGGSIRSAFEFIEGTSEAPPPGPGSKTKSGLNRVKGVIKANFAYL